jgi:hypothetical protein
LADFLAALRDELHEAAEGAKTDWLKLGVDELTLTVDVAYEKAQSIKGSVKAAAKFWVWLSAEAAAEATASGKTTRTHTLTLRLKPRIDLLDASDQLVSYGLDVSGELAAGEQRPTPPPLTESRSEVPSGDSDG